MTKMMKIMTVLVLILLAASCARTPVLKSEADPALFYTNPADFRAADPFVLRAADGWYYCYATSDGSGFVGWRSADLIAWESLGVIFRPGMGHWGMGSFWAPEAVYKDGRYYLFYSARWIKKGSLRIGAAVSDTPQGPFTEAIGRPLFDPGYAVIDAHVFVDDDGAQYLYYSRDCSENVVGGIHESHVYAIKLHDDLLSVDGEGVLLTKPDQPWELQSGDYRWNEGPFVVKHERTYYLMYSGNYYGSKQYAVGYAAADHPLGPFVKYDLNPVLQAEDGWTHVSGPGHNSVTASPDGRELWAVYHTHADPEKGGDARRMNIDRMGFRADGSLYMNGPSRVPMPRPRGTMEYHNIAADAEITSVSSPELLPLLTDGAVSFHERFSAYEWFADGDAPAVTLTWKTAKRAAAVLVFPGAGGAEKNGGCTVYLNGKLLAKDAPFPAVPGAPVNIGFEEQDVKEVRVIVSDLRNKSEGDKSGNDIRLSEIIVLGN